ncbi:MAG TPA: hypothetical protein VF354_05335 [Candidatus Methanoperedens sp.]
MLVLIFISSTSFTGASLWRTFGKRCVLADGFDFFEISLSFSAVFASHASGYGRMGIVTLPCKQNSSCQAPPGRCAWGGWRVQMCVICDFIYSYHRKVRKDFEASGLNVWIEGVGLCR